MEIKPGSVPSLSRISSSPASDYPDRRISRARESPTCRISSGGVWGESRGRPLSFSTCFPMFRAVSALLLPMACFLRERDVRWVVKLHFYPWDFRFLTSFHVLKELRKRTFFFSKKSRWFTYGYTDSTKKRHFGRYICVLAVSVLAVTSWKYSWQHVLDIQIRKPLCSRRFLKERKTKKRCSLICAKTLKMTVLPFGYESNGWKVGTRQW